MSGYGNKYIRKADGVTRLTPKQIRDSVDASLTRLKTDYLDLLQVASSVAALPLAGLLIFLCLSDSRHPAYATSTELQWASG